MSPSGDGGRRSPMRGNLKGSAVFSRCRDKDSLDIFWLRDESLEESDNLPDSDILAQEIVVDLKAALEQFREIARFSMPPSLHRKIRKLTNDKCWNCSR